MASPESTELKPQIITKQEISLRRKLKAECGNKSKGLIPSFRINYDRRKLPYLFSSHCFYNVTGHYGFPSMSFFPTAGAYMRTVHALKKLGTQVTTTCTLETLLDFSLLAHSLIQELVPVTV